MSLARCRLKEVGYSSLTSFPSLCSFGARRSPQGWPAGQAHVVGARQVSLLPSPVSASHVADFSPSTPIGFGGDREKASEMGKKGGAQGNNDEE